LAASPQSSYQAALSLTHARDSEAGESLNQWRPGSGGRYDGTGDWLARGFRRTGVAAPGTAVEERTAGSAAVGRGADLRWEQPERGSKDWWRHPADRARLGDPVQRPA